MRTLRIALLLACPALTGGASVAAAQAVDRTDVPARGVLRVTFDPRIMTWNDQFTDAGRMKLGAPLTGDTVGGRYIPVVSRLEQNVRVVSGISNFVASLGAGLLSVRQERRTYPTTAEIGLTNRLSVSLMVPMVRVATRASFQYSARGANLGVNPLVFNALGARGTDSVFFAQFDTALAQLDRQIAAGQYGCGASATCGARCTPRLRVRHGGDRFAVSAARYLDRGPGHRQYHRAHPARLERHVWDRGVRHHGGARVGHAQRRRVRADPPQPRSERVRVRHRSVHPKLPLPLGGRGARRQVPAADRRALRGRRTGAGAPADGGEGFRQRFPRAVGRRSPAGPGRASDAGAGGGAAVAQCGRPRRDTAAGDAGATRRAVGRVSGPGRGYGGPTLGSGRLRRRGRRAAGASGAGIRGRVHRRLFLQAARPLCLSIAAGLGGARDSHGIRNAGQRAGRGYRATLAAPRVRGDLPHAGSGGRLLDRANRQRRWPRPRGNGVSARAAGDSEAFLSSSVA